MAIVTVNRVTCASCGVRHEWDGQPPADWGTVVLQQGLVHREDQVAYELCPVCFRELKVGHLPPRPSAFLNLKEHLGPDVARAIARDPYASCGNLLPDIEPTTGVELINGRGEVVGRADEAIDPRDYAEMPPTDDNGEPLLDGEPMYVKRPPEDC